MKNSGIEWIGLIPNHWKIGKVKNWYKMNTGFTPDTKKSHYYDDESGYDWVTISDMTEKTKFISHTKSKISEDYLTEKNPIITKKGSLLYSFKLSVGKVAFAGKDIYTNEAIASFIPTSNVNLNFLFYSSSLIYGNANTNIYGAKLLNSELILNAPIIYPPLSEQQAIADFLDGKCAEIDNLTTAITEQIEVLKQYKKSVITEAVTKGLNPTAPMKDSGIEWIGDIPEKWEVGKIKYIANSIGSGTTPSSSNPEYYEDGTLPWIQSGDLYGNDYILDTSKKITTLAVQNTPSLSLQKKDFLVIAMYGASVGNVAISKIDAYTNQACCTIKANKNANLKFIYYYLKFANSYMLSKAIGGTQPNISQIIIKNLLFLIPSLPEQQAIADYLDDKCAQIDSVIKDKETQLETLASYKKSLIYEYVTGKKEVPQLKEV